MRGHLLPSALLLLGFLFAISETSWAAEPRLKLNQVCQSEVEPCQQLVLKGEWGFAKGKILSPQEILQSNSIERLNVPGAWNPETSNPFSDSWQLAYDVATYWMVLSDFPNWPHLTLSFNYIHGGYQVFWQALPVGGPPKLLLEHGWNAKEPMQSLPALQERYVPLPPIEAGRDYLLVVQVANSSLAKGGLRSAPILSSMEHLKNVDHKRMLFYCTLLGAIVIIAIYHLLLFVQRRNDKSTLWLALECLTIVAHTLFMQQIADQIWPEPSQTFVKIRSLALYSTHVLAPYFFFEFLRTSFPRTDHRLAIWLFRPALAINFVCVFLPLGFLTRLYLPVFIPIVLVLIVFIAWRTLSCMKGEPQLQILIVGILALAVTTLADAWAGTRSVNATSLLPYAQVAFILLQGGLISQRFAIAYRTAARLSRELRKEVERQTLNIRSILNSMRQGIFTVGGANLTVGAERSLYLQEALEIPLEAQTLKEVFFDQCQLDDDQKSQVEQVVKAALGEDELSFELNRGNLPQEVRWRDQQILEVDWSPMKNAQGTVDNVLVCLRDVTELKELRQRSEQHEKELQIIKELIDIPEARFRSFLQKVAQYLEENSVLSSHLHLAQSATRGEALRRIFMNLHTIKGSARTLQLRAIALAAHKAEQDVSEMQKESHAEDPHRMHAVLSDVASAVSAYQRIGQEKLGWNMEENHTRIPRQILLEAQSLLSHLLPELPALSRQPTLKVLGALQRIASSDIQSLMQDLARGLDSMARDLNKQPPILEVEGRDIGFSEEAIFLLQAVFTHILRNALDHGLETAEDRRLKGKPAAGVIRVSVMEQQRWALIEVQDDGRGLNLDVILRKAREKGMVPKTASLSDPEIADLIFQSGLSTREAVTEVSGRGVGMDAVRSYVENVGGKVELRLGPIDDREHVAFVLQIYLPQHLWWRNHAAGNGFEPARAI